MCVMWNFECRTIWGGGGFSILIMFIFSNQIFWWGWKTQNGFDIERTHCGREKLNTLNSQMVMMAKSQSVDIGEQRMLI